MKNYRLLSLIGFALLFSACASKSEFNQLRREQTALQTELETVRQEQRKIKQALLNMQKLIEEANRSTTQLRADLQLQLTRLERQSQMLEDQLKDTGQRLERMPPRVQIVTPEGEGGASTGRQDSLLQNVQNTLDDARKLYDSAYQDFVRGQYQLAESGFRQFLQVMPSSELSDNALYWIGEIYYAQRRYNDAIQAFRQVADQYPGADKVPAALLKIGYAQIAEGRNDAGLTTLQELIRQFPYSNEAKLAQARIQEMRN